MKRGPRLDLGAYVRAIPMLLRNPAMLLLPLLAAVVDLLISAVTPLMTDPLGGLGASIFGLFVQIVYMFAFGVCVIYASGLLRGTRTSFDAAWDEARHKSGGIILAAIGFQFIVYAAAYVGGILGAIGQYVLQLAAYFFLILTIPAAAIGGLPGGLAISGSIRAVRANPIGSAVLAIVFVALWIYLPILVAQFAIGLTPIEYELVLAAVRAVLLAYLAFPFAALYEETAFRGRY